MTRDHVVTAKRDGTPFEIRMADGRAYLIPDAEHVFIGKTTVTVMDEKDCPRVLPLLTMTGISYLQKSGA